MRFITEENLLYVRDRLASLETYREVALQAQGDERIRESVLAKIKKEADALGACFFEQVDANGTTRVRHPSIAVIEVAHEILPQPRRLWGNKIKSLVAYTIEVSLADALIDVDSVIRYEPYELVGRFTVSEHTFNTMMAQNGNRSLPVNIDMLKGHTVEPSIPDVFEAEARILGANIDRSLNSQGNRITRLIGALEERSQKGGKLSASSIEEFAKIGEVPSRIKSDTSHHIGELAEFSHEVITAQRLEVEALIALHRQQEAK